MKANVGPWFRALGSKILALVLRWVDSFMGFWSRLFSSESKKLYKTWKINQSIVDKSEFRTRLFQQNQKLVKILNESFQAGDVRTFAYVFSIVREEGFLENIGNLKTEPKWFRYKKGQKDISQFLKNYTNLRFDPDSVFFISLKQQINEGVFDFGNDFILVDIANKALVEMIKRTTECIGNSVLDLDTAASVARMTGCLFLMSSESDPSSSELKNRQECTPF